MENIKCNQLYVYVFFLFSELKPLAHTVTAIAPTPPIRLRVVNASDQDVTGVELGDPLFLKVELADESKDFF